VMSPYNSKRVRRSVFALIGFGLLSLVYLFYAWSTGLETKNKIYTVKRGTTLGQFARELQNDGVLPNRYTIILLAYLRGQHRGLKAGEYRFSSGISQRELLDQVVSGKSIQYSLLVPEGWNFREMMQAINKAGKLEHTLKDISPEMIMARLGKAGVHPEGRFFPDTYKYGAGTTDIALLKQAYDRMEQTLEKEWEERDKGLPSQTPYEALIMASIVEKETGIPEERPRIAGVFVNRLKKGMRLQTDPTVIYGLGQSFDGNLRRRDLRHDTPYNTYTRKGLPPTPIAMPGGDAIRAALHPAKTDHRYFVSRGNGTHKFSSSLKEHQKAVVEYQLGGKGN
jgi:UPF0755 protein